MNSHATKKEMTKSNIEQIAKGPVVNLSFDHGRILSNQPRGSLKQPLHMFQSHAYIPEYNIFGYKAISLGTPQQRRYY